MEVLDDVILAIRDMHQPVIAAVNGAAIGGGFCLASACRHPHRVRHRVLPCRRHQQRPHRPTSSASATCCRARSASSRAFDILLSGRDVDAEEAERIGLVSQVVPGDQLLERCYELRRRDHRLQPRRRRAHEAAAVGEPRRRQPPRAHEPRGQRAALRAHDHRATSRRRSPRGRKGARPCTPMSRTIWRY